MPCRGRHRGCPDGFVGNGQSKTREGRGPRTPKSVGKPQCIPNPRCCLLLRAGAVALEDLTGTSWPDPGCTVPASGWACALLPHHTACVTAADRGSSGRVTYTVAGALTLICHLCAGVCWAWVQGAVGQRAADAYEGTKSNHTLDSQCLHENSPVFLTKLRSKAIPIRPGDIRRHRQDVLHLGGY